MFTMFCNLCQQFVKVSLRQFNGIHVGLVDLRFLVPSANQDAGVKCHVDYRDWYGNGHRAKMLLAK